MEKQGTQLMQSFLADDHSAVDRLLEEHPPLRQHVNEGVFGWRMPPLAAAKSNQMADVLIKHGARVENVSTWWAPGFGVEQVQPSTARYLAEQGATLTIHAAAGIGLIEVVREMLEQDPDLVRAKGGDGCHPLHFCRDRELAALLIEQGADVDACDEDHHSTPAQWRIDDAPETVRFLLKQGATPDIFMAAGLGDLELAQQLVEADPECTSYRIGHNNGPFPGIGFQGRGGSIYQWSLGFNLSPHEVALKRGHQDIHDFLMQKSAPRTRFLVACTSANRPVAEAITGEHPQIIDELDEEDLSLIAKFCWETNKSIDAVRLMLDLGFPVEAGEHNHGCTALHNAAWCGDPDLVRLLLERGHPVDVRDPDHNSTPLGWAAHSCVEAKRHPDGRFAEVVELLLASGTPFDPRDYPVGDDAIDAAIKRHLDATKPGRDISGLS